MRLMTKNGRDFFAVSSLLQKSLRRGDVVLASRAVSELLPKYSNYVWNRLLVVSAEDCEGPITQEVMALYLAWCKLNDSIPSWKRQLDGGPGRGPASDMGWAQGAQKKGSRVFFMKAIVLLAKCKHSRDGDEVGLLVADRIPDEVFDEALNQVMEDEEELGEIPDWTYDVHTARGRRSGATRASFLRAEHDALANSASVFLNFEDMAKEESSYVKPRLAWDKER